jgi:hypothetical protein
MAVRWESEELYEHPAKHQAGVYGRVVLSAVGVYGFRVGNVHMSCSQEWAARKQWEEAQVGGGKKSE